jgi:CRISPR/Cas system CSM-associated protein Csm3 (group 7 of RAMP superfamily)
MGANTGNGFGRFVWQLTEVKELSEGGVRRWWESGCKESGMEIIATHGARIDKFSAPPLSLPSSFLTIGVTLKFAGSFLVNDPSRVSKVRGATVDHRPRLDSNGNPMLPESSFRGAFRSHAEKIIRTIGGHACRIDALEKGFNDPEKSCKAIQKKSNKARLCLACRLFGAGGWKSPIELSSFTLKQSGKKDFIQDFIAVDRFTGGVKDGAKFDAESVLYPRYHGVLRVDLQRMEPWGKGLLALLLRDLCEGDITFGFGSSKGYGACTAEVSWEGNSYPGLPWGDFSSDVEKLIEEINKEGAQ